MRLRDRSKLREALLLLLVGTLITMIGWRIKPPNDPAIQFSGQFVVAVPTAVTDSKGQPDPVVSVKWTEGHGQEAANVDSRWGRPNADSTRIGLRIDFDHAPGVAFPVNPGWQDPGVTVSFVLPKGASLDHCQVVGPGAGDCATQPSGPGGSDRGVTAYGVLNGASFDMDAELGHTTGLSFATNRKDVTVRYPGVEGPQPSDQLFAQPVQVTTEVHFDGASDVRWTPNPSSGYTSERMISRTERSHDDFTAWDYRFATLSHYGYAGINIPPNISGTRQSVINEDGDRVFYAGLAFGLAGGAYIGAVQALLAWLASGSGSGSSATGKHRRLRLWDKNFWRKRPS